MGIPVFAKSGEEGPYLRQNIGFPVNKQVIGHEGGRVGSGGEGALRAVEQLKAARRVVLSEKFKSVSSVKVLKEAGVCGNVHVQELHPSPTHLLQ